MASDPDELRDQPLDRALAVIESVLKARSAATLTEIAGTTGLPIATVHRIVGQLEGRGLLKRALGSRKLLPGPRLVALGAQILEASIVGDRGHLVLEALAKQIEEHCHIGIISGQDVLYVDSARSGQPARLHFEPGKRAPVYCTSIGKVFLASLPPTALGEFVDLIDFKPFTSRTIRTRTALLQDVDRVRERGWASSNEEFTPGVIGCAVPIHANSGEFIAGLGVSVPVAHCPYERIDEYVPALTACARELQTILQASDS